ncbi:MAG TPA: chromate efflux transporter [Thermodesulfobacteriota bacterium]|nr:chromate efflux transporter [Thermodesulfobacteriota bacterium]
MTANAPKHSVAFRDAFWVWVKVAIYSFGGPAGQIAVMHRILVEEKRWVSENRFLHALNYCMLLPGPEAQQLATYIGWLLHKTIGGLVAGILFVLPGFISILVLSIFYAGFQDTTLVRALFFGLKPAVMAVVVEAVIRIGKRALKNEVMIILAGLAFVAIFFFDVPFPIIIVSAGLIGFIGGKLREDKFYVIKGHESKSGESVGQEGFVITDDVANHTQPSPLRAFRVAVICLLLWFAPLALLISIYGKDSVFVTEGVFFSKAAVVTFGGAYAVLAYIAQEAVNTYDWLEPGEMLDGLGMAETTPGPLIMVVQFVGFMGAYRHPGTLDPLIAGVLGSVITTWVTFVPCFLWIFLGAPYIEYLRGNKSLSTALSAITAAVVGVILNLAVWFSLHTLFKVVNEIHTLGMRLQVPVLHSIDLVSLLIAIGAFVAMFHYRLSMIPTLTGSAFIGLVYYLVFRS